MEDYSAKLTAEPFLYNETKTIAKFLLDGEEEEKLRKRNIEETLIKYKWPGNIRELQNIIEYSVNMSSSNRITVDILPSQIKQKPKNQVSMEIEDIETLDELERREIIKALNKYKDYKKDKDLVAKALGISRATLYRKLDKYNIISKWDKISFWDFFFIILIQIYNFNNA